MSSWVEPCAIRLSNRVRSPRRLPGAVQGGAARPGPRRARRGCRSCRCRRWTAEPERPARRGRRPALVSRRGVASAARRTRCPQDQREPRSPPSRTARRRSAGLRARATAPLRRRRHRRSAPGRDDRGSCPASARPQAAAIRSVRGGRHRAAAKVLAVVIDPVAQRCGPELRHRLDVVDIEGPLAERTLILALPGRARMPSNVNHGTTVSKPVHRTAGRPHRVSPAES